MLRRADKRSTVLRNAYPTNSYFLHSNACRRKSVGQVLLNPFVQVGDFIDNAHFAELAELRSAADARVFRQRLRTDGQALFNAVFSRLSAR